MKTVLENIFWYLFMLNKNAMGTKSEVFTIFTEGCTIPGTPLISESIRTLVSHPKKIVTCSDNRRLVSSNSSHIWVVKEVYPYFNIWTENDFYCCYRNFSALSNINNIVYESCKEFTTIIGVNHEFVRTECYYLDDKIYDDFFIFNSKRTLNTKYNSDTYNVLILGIENMSRLNFHRTMPMTSKFLQDKGMLELLGYNKLGDNSFPNLFPTLTGRSFKDVKKICIKNNVIDVDLCSFIWQQFKKAGYYTALGSDSTAGLLGSYEYRLPCIPTDFYLQPFISETRNLFTTKNYDYHQCFGDKFYYKILVQYIQDLTHKLGDDQLFGFFWEESISHQEDINNPQIMDEDFFELLNHLYNVKYLNKTILIISSDHGMRWGKIVLTEQGRLEERLPMLGILFPRGFQSRYNLAFRNFRSNTKRLTTPFDIYETLLDLVNLNTLGDDHIKAKTKANNSVGSQSSLFLPVSPKRSCKSLGIEEHWCTCYKGKKLKAGNKLKVTAAQRLLRHINRILSAYSQCRELKLNAILDCFQVNSGRWERTYTVVIRTMPGDAVLDGTLVHNGRTWAVSGTVSRLNLYRNQSDCVDDALIKLYCFCS